VVHRADPSLLEPFRRAARELESRGVAAITSGCGFLVLFQHELAEAVGIPVFASSLVQLPMVYRMLRPDQKVGLLVADSRSLTPRHLAAVGAEAIGVCVAGMADQPEFREVVLDGKRDEIDADRLERETLEEVDHLMRDNPDVGAIVIECTDLVPFAHAIQARAGVPVFDIVTLTSMVYQSLTRRPFARAAQRPKR
jgi:Asp/Glu/hydantoin racemase